MNKNIICMLFGHKWRYNFRWMPSKAICARCKKKANANIATLTWENGFEDSRTDDELIKKWIK